MAKQPGNRRWTYAARAERLSATIEIAGRVTSQSEQIPADEKARLLEFGEEIRNLALQPAPEQRRVASLKYLETAFLTYWNESVGSDAERFWALIRAAGIEFERKDVIRDVLDRGRIESIHEYDMIVDNIVIAQQTGRISREGAAALSRMIGEFEAKQ